MAGGVKLLFFAGAVAGAFIVFASGGGDAEGAVAGAFIVSGGGDAAAGAVPAAAALPAANQVCTPWCPEHAPRFAGAEVYEPSLHWPVEPAGASDGACAKLCAASSNPAANVVD